MRLSKFVTILVILFTACVSATEPSKELITASPRTLGKAILPYVSINAERILLQKAKVYVGDGSPPLLHQDVFLEGASIMNIGATGTVRVPAGTVVVDASNKTVMPGIVGMHNHTHMPGNPLISYTAPRLYLASGVTTIATAGSADAEGELKLAAAIDLGAVPGPRLFPSAPYVTGAEGNGPMSKPATAQDARRFVDLWADRGVNWFKLYRHTRSDIAAAVINQAHQRGAKVTGHLCSITYADAARMGIDSLEHGLNAATDFVTDKPTDKCVPSRQSKLTLQAGDEQIGKLIDVLIANNVTLTSTLAIIESGFPHRPQADARSLSALSPERVIQYKQRQQRLAKNAAATTSSPPAYWKLLVDFERRFVAAGGALVAGPDTGRHVLPGFGDQRNYELFIEAGFRPEEAIEIMTHNGAIALGIGDRVGLIKAGYRADVLLIDGDLESDPSIIRSVDIVFREGVGYDPGKLLDDVWGKVGSR